MKWRLYKATEAAIEKRMDWDEIFAAGELETVEEFETLREAAEAYEAYDPDIYIIDRVRGVRS